MSLKDSIWSGEIFRNLLLYYGYRAFMKKHDFKNMMYHWENHNWDRMALEAAKSLQMPPKCIAYQHGQLPGYVLNHFPKQANLNQHHYPDLIISVGKRFGELLFMQGTFRRKSCSQELVLGKTMSINYLKNEKPSPPHLSLA